MTLREALSEGRFVVSAEACPPKGTDVTAVLHEAEQLRGEVQAFNVTDQQSSVMRLGSLVLCHMLAQKGLEPILQVTCRDRNRIALQSDMLSAAALGIENVLCLTGDHVSMGDHPQAKPVFDLDSVSLLRRQSGSWPERTWRVRRSRARRGSSWGGLLARAPSRLNRS